MNNAGIAVASPLEHLPLDELRRQLEVNVVGQLAVTQAFLPALRPARGRIVIVGSIAGKSALPFLGAYAMSKHALEAMADSLRVELATDGIHVAIVEPGTIATPIWTKPQRNADDATGRGSRALRRAHRGVPGRGGAAVRRRPRRPRSSSAPSSTRSPHSRPKSRYLVGRDAKIRATIERLPDRLRDRILTKALLDC